MAVVADTSRERDVSLATTPPLTWNREVEWLGNVAVVALRTQRLTTSAIM